MYEIEYVAQKLHQLRLEQFEHRREPTGRAMSEQINDAKRNRRERKNKRAF
ncbi:MAG: hypothetical protein Kow00117_15130 [Phototrophicales bacterium]